MAKADPLHSPGSGSIRFRVSPALIRLRCREGVIAHERDANGRYVVRESELVHWMAERAKKQRARARR